MVHRWIIVRALIHFLVTTTHAIPLPASSDSLATDGVYICPSPDWSGHCLWYRASIGPGSETRTSCNPLPDAAWISFGPDADVKCRVYQDSSCPDDPKSSKEIVSPGNAKLAGPRNEVGGGGRGIGYKAWQCWVPAE
jgi:hypothetical protein